MKKDKKYIHRTKYSILDSFSKKYPFMKLKKLPSKITMRDDIEQEIF